jgi:hypothetical protein
VHAASGMQLLQWHLLRRMLGWRCEVGADDESKDAFGRMSWSMSKDFSLHCNAGKFSLMP